MQSTLDIKNLHVSVESKPILKGLNLTVNKGENHAITHNFNFGHLIDANHRLIHQHI